jgi:hypothetical protein
MVGAELLLSRRQSAVAKTATACFHKVRIRCKAEFGILANAANTDGAGRNLFQHGGVSVAAIEGKYQSAFPTTGILIERLAELDHLLGGAQAEAGRTRVRTVLSHLIGGSLTIRFLRCRRVQKGNRGQTECALCSGHGAGDLKEALGAHEVGLEARPERIAPPCYPGVCRPARRSSVSSRTARNGAPAGS